MRIRPARSNAFIFFHSIPPAFRGADLVDAREIGLDHRSETDRERNALSRVALIGNHQPSSSVRFGSVVRSRTLLAEARTTVDAFWLLTETFWATALPAKVEVDAATDIVRF